MKGTKVFRFIQSNGGHFRLAVFAKSLKAAKDYVKAQAVSSVAHRGLNYIGQGNPSNYDGWVAAKVEKL